ncbi:hypothetical protein MHY29_04715, partial [Micrococcus sp. ACRRV]|uniref:hypothetical protein n=1 Tax=Micrococcus sp. ACRRV TaxID=2918203 RepID=UPI001EF2C824
MTLREAYRLFNNSGNIVQRCVPGGPGVPGVPGDPGEVGLSLVAGVRGPGQDGGHVAQHRPGRPEIEELAPGV